VTKTADRSAEYMRGRRDAFAEVRDSAEELRDLEVAIDGPPIGQRMFHEAQKLIGNKLLDVLDRESARSNVRREIYTAVDRERSRQDAAHGAGLTMPAFDAGEPVFGSESDARRAYETARQAGTLTYAHVIAEELAEAWQAFAAGDHAGAYRELLEATASCVKALEAMRARHAS